ncbi:glycosyltransferase family 2 protein [Bifidobacterium sp. MA2]|uniref:Glycosyltransferase family 2 protein n=2 Tax=Bifidobacterium santillanense TaxID=2809028 RepID=A0ABS5URL0_9BIFI|nr:glycosyltransferase family 2 protein [Bifidobacterium santillanense]
MSSQIPAPAAIEPTGEERAARRANRAGRATPKFVAATDDAASRPPLVTVIVTVRDAAETLRFCVDSILRQSYANLEVILVDDGSVDDGPAILDEYARRDDRVTTIFLKDDKGDGPDDTERGDVAARARNAALDAAHGEYVAFVGSDGVLDRRNIELLLHALIKTGADMAKSRWERFTIDQLYGVAETAAEGAREPETVTVFTDALEAYQSVFLKSLRVIGDEFGHNTEARYLHDEDWGRLYRASVWDGVRLPEDIYSPELLAAGELYSRMAKVADVDVVLYRWLREDGDAAGRGATDGAADIAEAGVDEPASASSAAGAADATAADGDATGARPARRFRYYHDTFTAGTANFRFAHERGILPGRSYYTMTTAYSGAKTAPDFDEPENQRQFELDTAELEELRGMLTFRQRLQCGSVHQMRLFEEGVRKWLPASMSESQYTPMPEELE